MKSGVEKVDLGRGKASHPVRSNFLKLLRDAGLRWRSQSSQRGWDDAGFLAIAAHSIKDLEWGPERVENPDDQQIIRTLKTLQSLCVEIRGREEPPTLAEEDDLCDRFRDLVQDTYFWGHRTYDKRGESLKNLIADCSEVPDHDLSTAALEITYIGKGVALVCCQWKVGAAIEGWVVLFARKDSGPFKVSAFTQKDLVLSLPSEGESIRQLLETFYATRHFAETDKLLGLMTDGAWCLDPRNPYPLNQRRIEKMNREGGFREDFLKVVPLRFPEDEGFRGIAVTDVRSIHLGEDLAVVTHRGHFDGTEGEILMANSAAIMLRHEGSWRVNFIVIHFSPPTVHSTRSYDVSP